MSQESSTLNEVPLVVLAGGRATRYGGVKPLAPVGPSGEAIIDVLASDAFAAGFRSIVLVIGRDTGPAIRYHVDRSWPAAIDVRFALQPHALGTVDAVLAAAPHLEHSSAFAVANGDDLPGADALALLARHLTRRAPSDAIVCFALERSGVGTEPVTRGICRVEGGHLAEVTERRHVSKTPDGRFVAQDDRAPKELDPKSPVNVNLFGFQPGMLAVLETAMASSHRHSARGARTEVLLPEAVNRVLSGELAVDAVRGPIEVLWATGCNVGVTHARDVGDVQVVLAEEIGRGDRPAALWTGTGAASSP